MVTEKSNGEKPLNTINIQFDEHSSTKPGIQAVFGEEFVRNRTSGCEYHIQKSVDKHKKFLNVEDGNSFNFLVTGMKNSITEEGYLYEKA